MTEKNIETSPSGVCYVKEPWYTRFIPEALHTKWYRFKTRNEVSNYELHARREMRAMLADDADEMDKLMAEQVIDLLRTFSKHGHSGFSAPYAVNMFSKLAKYEPLGPLTGEDSEWNCISDYCCKDDDYATYQNNRASHVFKHVYTDGRPDYAYDINGKVFVDVDGCSYTSNESKVEITFPYDPTTEYVTVESDDKEE